MVSDGQPTSQHGKQSHKNLIERWIERRSKDPKERLLVSHKKRMGNSYPHQKKKKHTLR